MHPYDEESCFWLAMPTFIIFLILKLDHAINWSWWWVTAPVWVFILIAHIIPEIIDFFDK